MGHFKIDARRGNHVLLCENSTPGQQTPKMKIYTLSGQGARPCLKPSLNLFFGREMVYLPIPRGIPQPFLCALEVSIATGFKQRLFEENIVYQKEISMTFLRDIGVDS